MTRDGKTVEAEVTIGGTKPPGAVMVWASGIAMPAVPESGDDTERTRFIVGVETWVGRHYGIDGNQWQNCVVTPWDVEQYKEEMADMAEQMANDGTAVERGAAFIDAALGAKEEGTTMTDERQAQGFSEADISAIMHECPNTAEAYRTDRMVLRATERIIGKEALGDARMYRAGTGPEAGTFGADALHGVYYRMTVADYAFSFAYVNGGEDGRAWRTIVRSLVDVEDWARAGEVMEIMDRYAGDWQDAITSVKAMYLRGVEGVTLTGADVALLLAGDDEWTLEDENTMETVLECRVCGGRERFQTAEGAYAFANGETGEAEEHLHVAHTVSVPAGDVAVDGAVVAVHAGSQGGDAAGAAERYTVKVKGAAPEAYAIDGGPFDAFAALVVLAQSVSKAENTIAYVRDNQHGGIAIAFEGGEQVAPHKAWAEVRPFV